MASQHWHPDRKLQARKTTEELITYSVSYDPAQNQKHNAGSVKRLDQRVFLEKNFKNIKNLSQKDDFILTPAKLVPYIFLKIPSIYGKFESTLSSILHRSIFKTFSLSALPRQASYYLEAQGTSITFSTLTSQQRVLMQEGPFNFLPFRMEIPPAMPQITRLSPNE